MGNWGHDLIGGDDTLECAMLFLAAAGIAPPNFEDDISVVPMYIHSIPLCQEGENLFYANLDLSAMQDDKRDAHFAQVHSAASNTPGSQGTMMLRRSYATYVEWYACLERAKGCRKELENTGIDKWMRIIFNTDDTRGSGCGVGNPWVFDHSNEATVGHKFTILAWILMRAGAAVPIGFKKIATKALDAEVTKLNWTQVSE